MRSCIPSRTVVCAALLATLWALSFPHLILGRSLSDQKYQIDVWDADQGLPQSSATSFVQTPDGYLWFGTFDGLVRFDGLNFTVFDRSNVPDLPHPAIINLHLDRKGRFWISTFRGMAYVKDGQWRVFREGSGWIGNYVRFFAETPSGQLYVTTFDNKILRFRGDGFEELPLPPADPKLGFIPYIDEAGALWVVNPQFIGKFADGKWQETVSAAALLKEDGGKPSLTAGPSRDGGLWIATTKHLRKYRGGRLVSETRAPWDMGGFWNLREDSAGTVWICSWTSGLYRYSPGEEWRHYTTENGLSNNYVRDLFEDREGNLWIGTDTGGLIRFKPRNFVNWGFAEGLPGRELDSIAEDGGGRILVGTTGHGVVSIQGSTVRPALLPSELKHGSDAIVSLLVDHQGRLWLGTRDDGVYRVDHFAGQHHGAGEHRHSRAVQVAEGTGHSLFEDSHGRIWIGTDQGVLRFDGTQFKEYPLTGPWHRNLILGFAEDRQSGILWAGSALGILRLEGNEFVAAPEASELTREAITSLFADKDGTLWIATAESGIACLRKGHLTRISEKHGIPARSLGSMLDDGQGNFWLGSNRGILRISRAELETVMAGRKRRLAVQVFNRSDGLATVDSAIGDVLKDPGGRLWFLTEKGAVMVDPKNLRLNTKPPLLAIEDVLIDGQSAGPRKEFATSAPAGPVSVTISPGSHRLEIHYTALSFTAAEKIRFRYMLEGPGKEWIDIGDHRVVYLQDLKPGSHRVRIGAANNDGVWNETGALAEIRWKPHFYQTRWFFAMGMLGLAFVVAGAFRLRLRHVRTRELQLEHLVGERTGQLEEEVEERKRAETALSQARDELEDRVRQRTAELAAANAALEADIRERTRIEEELRRSEDKFAKAFHSSPVAMSISSLDAGQIIDINEGFLKLYGFQRHEVIGRTAAELQTWIQSPSCGEIVTMLRQQRPVRNLETRFQTKAGKSFDALFSGELIPFGGQDCLLAVTLDFTEQKRLEEELRQSQKMEALGQLAGGVAHDFNNLLEVIIGYSEILRDTTEANTRQNSQIQQVQKAAQRAAALTRQLLAFGRKQVLQPTALDLNAAISEVEKLLRRLIGENIEFITRLEPALGSVRADRGQIEQVILNLCVNARDAMPAGGKLTIGTANVNLDEAFADTHPEAMPGPYVMLSVSDNGVGMDAVTRARIFEPFFTTKERGRGTGLGLSTVYGIVKQSGGHIWVCSEPGRGTTFKLYLPRVAQPATAAEPARAPSEPIGGSETVLLAEDEESVRGLISDALSARGYRVLSAPNAENALEISQAHVQPIHILVTDMVMPGKSGNELARELLRSRPNLRILYLSGYTDNHFPDTNHGAAFLQKPFTLRALAGKVRELLNTLPSPP